MSQKRRIAREQERENKYLTKLVSMYETFKRDNPREEDMVFVLNKFEELREEWKYHANKHNAKPTSAFLLNQKAFEEGVKYFETQSNPDKT